ncbi:L-asparaginase [Orussus abietinus]|uniref:L-asparaginase n=1 Tax=Orussus abietinus TaxID=222816 RepID=UPI00062605B9|nr:L-asparaginase [Orussus abietinus]
MVLEKLGNKNSVTSTNELSVAMSRASLSVGADNEVTNDATDVKRDFEMAIRRNKSTGHLPSANFVEMKILVLYTGGTIGMVRTENGVLAPLANAFVKNLRTYPQLHDRIYAEERFGGMGPLVLPMGATDKRRVIYNVLEYSPLCDSSTMTMDHWIRIAMDIKESYVHFDGFVVLHGTDTMSYTASALSFMLESLGKTVIITGSQLPIFEPRGDGIGNFLTSLMIAASYDIPEVCVFFGSKLMRGNRTSKLSTASFDAFHSPNAPLLATAEMRIQVDYRSIFRPCTLEKFHVHTSLNRNVGLLRLFPVITSYLVKAFLQPPIEGVVLQCYGAGNVPENREDIIAELRTAIKRGVIIVNITQCTQGGVSNIYETGKILSDIGVISGFDMTPEAALTKLAYVLSKPDWDLETRRSMMLTNLRGEFTETCPPSVRESDPFHTIARSLRLTSPSELRELGSILFPAMLNAAAVARDVAKLKILRSYGADVSHADADARTVLHIACSEGDAEIVRCLLEMGANVHTKDKFGRTPLTDAVEFDRHEVIEVLLKCGAHLHGSARLIGEKMCSAAAAGNLKRLRSYHLAGADLSQEDTSGRTALHLAVLHDHVQVAQFLLDHCADPQATDMVGHTPFDLAELAKSDECAKLLEISTMKCG